ncbi:MAG: sensor histidine kinase [Jatrophihabitantaceae bacterium]
MTIRTRLALLFTAAVLALVAGGSVLFVKRLGDGLNQSLDVRLATRAASVLAVLQRPGDNLSTPFLYRLRLGNTNGIYAQLLSTQGTEINTSRGLGNSPLISPGQAARTVIGAISADTTAQLIGPDERTAEPMRLMAVHNAFPSIVVVVATSREVVDKAIAKATQQLLILCGVVLLLAGPAAWLLTRAALRPVERMRRQVAGMRATEVGSGIAIPKTRDEIARLANTFNQLLARLHAANEREKAFVTDTGHELRTPLAVLKGELELAQSPNRTREELRETVTVAAEETERLVRLAEDLLLLARDDEAPVPRLTRFDLAPVVDQAIRAVGGAARARDLDVRLAANGPVPINAELDRIRRAVDNLLTNAIRYAPLGGWIEVGVEMTGTHVQVTVSDNGPGFPTTFLPIAFDRFTRAESPTGYSRSAPAQTVLAQTMVPAQTGGNGLGLAIVHSVIASHGGTATAANGPSGGAVVTLRWPADASVVQLRPLL